MSNWQPFNTAPEDDSFLVWLEEPHEAMKSNVGIMRRHPNCSFINGLFAFDLAKPTHWMPLPKAPEDL